MKETVSKKVNAKEDFPGAELSTEFDFGANLEEMLTLFGEETVFEMAAAKAVIVVQAELSKLATGKNEDGTHIYPDGAVPTEDIAAHFSNYTLEYKRGRAGKTDLQKMLDKMSKMGAEEAEAFKVQLAASLGL